MTGKLARYRQALDAGADPAVVAGWIARTQAERAHAEDVARAAGGRTGQRIRMSTEEVSRLVDALGNIATLAEADPAAGRQAGAR